MRIIIIRIMIQVMIIIVSITIILTTIRKVMRKNRFIKKVTNIFVVEVSENLNFTQSALTESLMLERTDFFDGQEYL
jgi:hypothetical protein